MVVSDTISGLNSLFTSDISRHLNYLHNNPYVLCKLQNLHVWDYLYFKSHKHSIIWALLTCWSYCMDYCWYPVCMSTLKFQRASRLNDPGLLFPTSATTNTRRIKREASAPGISLHLKREKPLSRRRCAMRPKLSEILRIEAATSQIDTANDAIICVSRTWYFLMHRWGLSPWAAQDLQFARENIQVPKRSFPHPLRIHQVEMCE